MKKNIENIAKKYYNINLELANSLIVSENNCSKFEVDENEEASKFSDLKNRLAIKLKNNGKISNVLLNQLLKHHLQVGEKYIIQNNGKSFSVIDFFQSREILDLIESLENEVCTIKQRPFNGEFLKGLMHVHHGTYATMGYSAVQNCIVYWYNNEKMRPKKIPEFQALLDESEHDLGVRMYQKAIFSKIKNGLTGEWLIYKKHLGKKYYLCLAKHDEGDEFIFENKVQPCLVEFPELNKEIKIVEGE